MLGDEIIFRTLLKQVTLIKVDKLFAFEKHFVNLSKSFLRKDFLFWSD